MIFLGEITKLMRQVSSYGYDVSLNSIISHSPNVYALFEVDFEYYLTNTGQVYPPENRNFLQTKKHPAQEGSSFLAGCFFLCHSPKGLLETSYEFNILKNSFSGNSNGDLLRQSIDGEGIDRTSTRMLCFHQSLTCHHRHIPRGGAKAELLHTLDELLAPIHLVGVGKDLPLLPHLHRPGGGDLKIG